MASNKLILGSGEIEGDFHNITAAGALEARNGSAHKIRVAGAAVLTRFKADALSAAGAVDFDTVEIGEGRISGSADMKGICNADKLRIVGNLSAESLHCRHLIFGASDKVHIQVNDGRASEEQSTASGKIYGEILESEKALNLSADCKFDSFVVSGELTSDRAISCENFYAFGRVNLPLLNAEKIFLLSGFGGRIDEIEGSSLTLGPTFRGDSAYKNLGSLSVKPQNSSGREPMVIRQISCDEVRLAAVHCEQVECEYAEITADCEIGVLICGKDSRIDEGAKIGKIVCDGETTIIGGNGTNGKINQEHYEANHPNAANGFAEILEAYRAGRIDTDEAEQLADKIKGRFGGVLPWADDGTVRIVAFNGQKLLEKGNPDYRKLEAALVGDVGNVVVWGNLTCGDVRGDVDAGSHVSCGDIGGSVSAGSSVSCADVEKDVSAGSSVNCGDVNGNILAGSSVQWSS